jgi:hypothetical protein
MSINKRSTRTLSQTSTNSPVASPISTARSDKDISRTCLGGCSKSMTSGQKALQCNFCNHWCHTECDGRISSKLYTELNKNPSGAILFCCKNCKQHNKPTSISESDNTLIDIKNAVEKIEKQLLTQGEVIRKIDTQTQDLPTHSYADVVKATNEISTVVKRVESTVGRGEIEARKLNAIVFGLNDTSEHNPEDSVKHLLDELSLHVTVNSCHRLGRRPDNPARFRPVKISFRTENDKWSFLKRLNSIKPNNIYGKLDLSQEERSQEKMLVEKLRELRGGHKDADSKYKIKNWAVQEVLPSGGMKVIYELPTQI